MDELSFVAAVRAGGRSQQERSYRDITINRRRLSTLASVGDNITPFGWLARPVERRYARQLALLQPSDFATGHVPLYICPECADLGCGAVTVLVRAHDDCIVWSEIGFDDWHVRPSPYKPLPAKLLLPDLRDYWFDVGEYRAALAQFL